MKYLNIFGMIVCLALPYWGCGQCDYQDTRLSEKPQVTVVKNSISSGSEPMQEPDVVPPSILSSRQNAITQAVTQLMPAIVGINVTQIREYIPRSTWDDPFFQFFFPGYRYRREVKSLGSGFFISQDGYILTNEHVVQGAVKIVISLTDGNKYDAEVIGTDYVTDIALLKIDGNHFPFCQLGNSDDILIGEWIIALGNPYGLFDVGQQPTVTVGVISSKNLDFGKQDDDRLYQDMIQTDASINPGNSGGPMANALGQVIGMNTFIFTGDNTSHGSIGLGFAIPINKVKDVVEQLKSYGKVDRQFWTGLEVDNLRPSVAYYFGLKNMLGVIVTNVEKNSPAERAGIQTSDIIVELNGEKISNTIDIWNVLDNMDAKAGDTIRLKIFRQGHLFSARLKLGKVK